MVRKHPTITPNGAKPAGVDWRLTRYLLKHLAIGAISGWIFVGGVLFFDVGGLRSLTAASSAGQLAILMLLAAITITWGAAAMGTAVFLMKDKNANTSGGKMAAPFRRSALTPARATVRPRA